MQVNKLSSLIQAQIRNSDLVLKYEGRPPLFNDPFTDEDQILVTVDQELKSIVLYVDPNVDYARFSLDSKEAKEIEELARSEGEWPPT